MVCNSLLYLGVKIEVSYSFCPKIAVVGDLHQSFLDMICIFVDFL